MRLRILLFLGFLAGNVHCQAEDKAPSWEETTSFVTRTLEHYGKYFIFGHPNDGSISSVTITPKTLSYQFSVSDDPGSGKINNVWTHIISFPLDRLDISSIKASKSESLSKSWDQSIFYLQFYCLEGKCVQETILHRALGNDGQWADQEKTGPNETDSYGVTSTDEDEINRLARALKHLATLAGSPSKELFRE